MSDHRLLKILGVGALTVASAIGSALEGQSAINKTHKPHKAIAKSQRDYCEPEAELVADFGGPAKIIWSECPKPIAHPVQHRQTVHKKPHHRRVHKHHETNLYVGETAVIPPGPRNDLNVLQQQREAQMQLEQAAGTLNYRRDTAGPDLLDTRTSKQIDEDKQAAIERQLKVYNPHKKALASGNPRAKKPVHKVTCNTCTHFIP